jgi:hypothetical protein
MPEEFQDAFQGFCQNIDFFKRVVGAERNSQ